jgi:hypothetical protein
MLSKHKPLELFLILIALALFASSAVATMFDVQIDGYPNAIPGSIVTIPVSISTHNNPIPGLHEINGFDLLIVYDTAALTFTGATPGPLFDIPGSYEWEYFESRVDSTGPQSGLIRAVALAETNNGDHHPVSVFIPQFSSFTLFMLEFAVTADPPLESTDSPIRFYWMDCGDNAIVPDSLGETLALSDRVFDWVVFDNEITDHSYGLPGIYGAPDSCLLDPSIIRAIDYYNGGITILGPDTLEFRGDINCNGIPYEIADYVQYAYYFVVGLGAFGDHLECSIVASDINRDGIELTVADFVYLYRVIIGDAVPYPASTRQDNVAATFTQDDDAGLISFDYPDSLAAIHLVFDGEIIPTLLFSVEGIVMGYDFIDGRTRVLIAPDISSYLPVFMTTGGPFLSYTGSALLIEADAADYNGTIFQIGIENIGSNLSTPFSFEIGVVQDAVQGEDVSIPIIKTGGSEKMGGFDMLIGYDHSALYIDAVSPGIPFDIPGDYEWEYFSYRFGPFDCIEGCPSGIIRIVGVAETPNGAHNPYDIPIQNGTVLFNIDGQVSPDPTFEGLFIPVRFFWLDCGDNAIAAGEFGDTLAISDHVYDHDDVEITDPIFGFPGFYGAPDSCIEPGSNPPIRFADFKNGGVDIVDIDSMKLILSIDNTTASSGDTAIYLDVRMSNPQDSVAGFVMYIQMDNSELVEFGISPSDTLSIDVENTMISDWDLISTQSITGQYHDLRIVALSNSMPPYTSSIPPQHDGLLLRLVLHAYDSIPEFVTDSTTQLMINDVVSNTHFSDLNGELIGVTGGQYDPQTVSFQNGSITIVGFTWGDANGDRQINVADAVFLIQYTFRGGPAPDPLLSGDANCDGSVNVADAVYIINHVFKGGPEPTCQ